MCLFYSMGKVSTVKLSRGNCDDFASIGQGKSAFPAQDYHTEANPLVPLKPNQGNIPTILQNVAQFNVKYFCLQRKLMQ